MDTKKTLPHYYVDTLRDSIHHDADDYLFSVGADCTKKTHEDVLLESMKEYIGYLVSDIQAGIRVKRNPAIKPTQWQEIRKAAKKLADEIGLYWSEKVNDRRFPTRPGITLYLYRGPYPPTNWVDTEPLGMSAYQMQSEYMGNDVEDLPQTRRYKNPRTHLPGENLRIYSRKE